MSIFRTQNRVPEIYPNESRDFQLLCRAYDAVFNGIKYDTDMICQILDTGQCPSNLLSLLQTKLGFFTNIDITDENLRYVLKAFPLIMKNKGSSKAIVQAINTLLKLNHFNGSSYISIINKTNDPQLEPYTIRVGLEYNIRYVEILEEIFKYIVPAGYRLKLFYYTPGVINDMMGLNEQFKITSVSDTLNSLVPSRNEVAGTWLFKENLKEYNHDSNKDKTISIDFTSNLGVLFKGIKLDSDNNVLFKKEDLSWVEVYNTGTGLWKNNQYRYITFNDYPTIISPANDDTFTASEFINFLIQTTDAMNYEYTGAVGMSELAEAVIGYYCNDSTNIGKYRQFFVDSDFQYPIEVISNGSLLYIDIPTGKTYKYFSTSEAGGYWQETDVSYPDMIS